MSLDLVRAILKGDVRAVAAAMTLIENGAPEVKSVLKAIFPHTGRAYVIGVTGAAGTGKSSLLGRLTTEYRRRKKRVGILAVDPSSPFSSGALLGDRIRMRDHFLDDEVFIRSFATRGRGGGVAAAVRDAIHLLDAMGKDVIFVETIGVGQDQLAIAALAHWVLVVLTPQMGDEVQGMKAGLAEIADMLVVNKSDLPGAAQTVEELEDLFANSHCSILATSALRNEGVQALVNRIEEQRAMGLANGKDEKRRLQLYRGELLFLLREKVFEKLVEKLDHGLLDAEVRKVARREVDPYSAVDRLVKRMGL
jgi:LAO/AO transport system kinase